MTKDVFSIHITDVSAFARQMGRALHERARTRPGPPGHTELLNLIARSQGQRNWQALRQQLSAAATAGPAAAAPVLVARPPAAHATPAAPPSAPAEALSLNARKALSQFDAQGRLVRWPAKYSVQKLVMWALWSLFDAKRPYTEREVNAVLKAANLFSDHVTLRRELINHRLMSRRPDGSDYRKLPARPDDEARALLTAWRAQQRG
jgi:hypothetical protein